ncbi:hypothetical protein J6590_088417 [Homalodisca vitripennis]|nr:hypothetical protein J6590_088417 [Homalodisca vitripennis]
MTFSCLGSELPKCPQVPQNSLITPTGNSHHTQSCVVTPVMARVNDIFLPGYELRKCPQIPQNSLITPAGNSPRHTQSIVVTPT